MINLDLINTDGLRADFRSADFTFAGIQRAVSGRAFAAFRRERPELLRNELAQATATTPLATLIQLFVLGKAVPEAVAARALPTCDVTVLIDCGLLEAQGADVRASVEVFPQDVALSAEHFDAPDHLEDAQLNWWIVSDWSVRVRGSVSPSHVVGVGGASEMLANLTMRQPVHRTLDLGTGSGIQALYASLHSDEVVATDISPRAINLARLTHRLSRPQRDIDFRVGHFFEPVAGETFDLIVSNPPFVISPPGAADDRLTYRDSGLPAGTVMKELIAQVGGFLTDQGVCQMLGSWEYQGGRHWDCHLRDWIDQAGLAAWIVQRDSQDPAQYAEMWLRDSGYSYQADHGAHYQRWVNDFVSRDIERIGFGFLTLSHPSDKSGPDTQVRTEEVTGHLEQPLGPHLAQCWRAQHWLAVRSDEDLLAERLQKSSDLQEVRVLRPGSGEIQRLSFHQPSGFGRTVHTGTATAAVVGACDGDLPLGVLIEAVAHLVEAPALQVRDESLPIIREMVATGMLRCASDYPDSA